nr:MAG TPA: hypothetical protein [Caudoviricetes sp.]DAX08024.1 MAG TPA: hypothetical protein [Bacteriophage sp.]
MSPLPHMWLRQPKPKLFPFINCLLGSGLFAS